MTATERRRGAHQKYNEKLTAQVGFIMTPTQKEKLIRYSEETGLSMGDVLRDCIDAMELAEVHDATKTA